MAGIKKLKAPGSSQNFMSSDVRSGNNGCQPGAGTSVGTKYVNWPFDPASEQESVNPQQNRVQPPRLSNSNAINTGLN